MASPARIRIWHCPIRVLGSVRCAGSLVGMNPNAKLAGAHEGPVADLLAAAPDRNAVHVESEDWCSAGMQSSKNQRRSRHPSHARRLFRWIPPRRMPNGCSANHRFHRQCSWQSGTGHLAALPCQPFRRPGRDERGHPNRNQVAARRPDCRMGSIESVHDLAVDLDLVDMEGVTSDEPNCSIPWPSARNHARYWHLGWIWTRCYSGRRPGGLPFGHGTGCRTGRIAIGQLDTVEQLS